MKRKKERKKKKMRSKFAVNDKFFVVTIILVYHFPIKLNVGNQIKNLCDSCCYFYCYDMICCTLFVCSNSLPED